MGDADKGRTPPLDELPLLPGVGRPGPSYVASIDDPSERARVANDMLTAIVAYRDWYAEVRRRAIRELREEGRTLDDVAHLLGLTKSRISQIMSGQQ